MPQDSSVASLHRNDKAPVISTEGRNLMPRDHRYYVYLLTNKSDKVMYVGVTNQLERRVYEHKTKMIPGVTEKYNVNKLVYFEDTHDVRAAIAREKEIKQWRREKKNNLVVAVNPEWKDLSDGWFEISPCGRDDNGTIRDDKNGIRRNDNGTIREVVV
jgi:putative endonuclease